MGEPSNAGANEEAIEFMARCSRKGRVGEMRIELAPDIETRLRAALRKAGPREIGGMLMAEQLRPGHFRIVDYSLDVFSGSHTRVSA